ncbi:MAG: protein-L-isoaspartate(D-aspartate) O-methyltransferase [Prevotellaceae bacterium]|jgi:protein-L-isoaspartate(D-aspartate) O-methyltransferase|nr:protein-L-isoaspartate(D-aspartate) O-methyltransferase [Prevotellaceae bacterium]
MELDDFRYKGLRRRMTEQLRAAFHFNERVLEAMDRIPRHLFVDRGMEHLAYLDRPLAIAAGQTISRPFTVAMQTHLLDVKTWEKVLEIGTGCGYQTAVLAELGAKVYSIERQRALYDGAQRILAALQCQVMLFYGDGYAGKPVLGPFHKIIVTCGAPDIPLPLKAQLAVGGRMVIPVGEGEQTMTVVDRLTETDYRTSTHGAYSFVPMLEGINKGTI